MKKPLVIPESESGKPCYIMIGDALKYESAFHSTYQQVKNWDSGLSLNIIITSIPSFTVIFLKN